MAGSWTAISDTQRQAGIFAKDRFFRVISATFTADAADGSVPNLSLTKASLPGFGEPVGYLVKLVTKPGGTAPTDQFDVTLEDENAIDVLGGAGTNRPQTGAQVGPIISAAGMTPPPVSGALTLKVAGNSVNSATSKVELWFAE